MFYLFLLVHWLNGLVPISVLPESLRRGESSPTDCPDKAGCVERGEGRQGRRPCNGKVSGILRIDHIRAVYALSLVRASGHLKWHLLVDLKVRRRNWRTIERHGGVAKVRSLTATITRYVSCSPRLLEGGLRRETLTGLSTSVTIISMARDGSLGAGGECSGSPTNQLAQKWQVHTGESSSLRRPRPNI